MNRSQLARFVSRAIGRRIAPGHIWSWEERGLLDRRARRGRYQAARFAPRDIVRACAVARLRLLEGEPTPRVRRASEEIARRWPLLESAAVIDRRGRLLFYPAGTEPPELVGPVLPLGDWARAARDAAENKEYV